MDKSTFCSLGNISVFQLLVITTRSLNSRLEASITERLPEALPGMIPAETEHKRRGFYLPSPDLNWVFERTWAAQQISTIKKEYVCLEVTHVISDSQESVLIQMLPLKALPLLTKCSTGTGDQDGERRLWFQHLFQPTWGTELKDRGWVTPQAGSSLRLLANEMMQCISGDFCH